MLIGLPFLWLLLFFFVPFAIVLKLALSEPRAGAAALPAAAEWIDDAGDCICSSRLNLSQLPADHPGQPLRPRPT